MGKKLQKNTTFSLIRSVRERYQILLIINRRQRDVIASSLKKIPICFIRNADFLFLNFNDCIGTKKK